MAVPGHGGEEAPVNGSAVTPPLLQAAGIIFNLKHFVNSLGTGRVSPLLPSLCHLVTVRAVQCLQSIWGLLAEAGPAQSLLWEALGIPDGCEPSSPAPVL